MLFLCGLTCRIILYNRPCTSQRGIALPLWKPLLNQQQYPARITWRFLIRAGAAAPLSNFALTRKVVLKRRMASLNSVRPRCLQPRVCRNSSGKLLSHPFAGLTALRGVPPRELPAGCIKELCTAPIKTFPPSPRFRRKRENVKNYQSCSSGAAAFSHASAMSRWPAAVGCTPSHSQ